MDDTLVVDTTHGKFHLPGNFVQIERQSGLLVYYAPQVIADSVGGLDLPAMTNLYFEITVSFKVSRGLPPTDFLERCADDSGNPLYSALRRVLGDVLDTGATAFVFGRRRDRQPGEMVPTGVPVPISAGVWELLALVCKPG